MNSPEAAVREQTGSRSELGYLVPFVLLHASFLAVIFVPWTLENLAVLAVSYSLRAIGVTAGYHRYFSHRSFKTGRVFQFVLAFLGTAAVQKGVLWWAANHRLHHRHADADGDPHSPRRGFWWSHMGWFLSSEYAETDLDMVRDLSRYPELRWLERHFLVPPLLFAAVLFALGGFPYLVWGFAVCTVVGWHATYAVNSLGHWRGSRRFDTADDSRNSFWLGLITWGEGWHNNHHRCMRAARHGLKWWEIDLTYYVLVALSFCGVVWELVEPANLEPPRAPVVLS